MVLAIPEDQNGLENQEHYLVLLLPIIDLCSVDCVVLLLFVGEVLCVYFSLKILTSLRAQSFYSFQFATSHLHSFLFLLYFTI